MAIWLKQSIVPVAIVLILSTCFMLGGYMYNTVYQPLLSDPTTEISATDYAIPTAKLNLTTDALDARASRQVDFSKVPNNFKLPE